MPFDILGVEFKKDDHVLFQQMDGFYIGKLDHVACSPHSNDVMSFCVKKVLGIRVLSRAEMPADLMMQVAKNPNIVPLALHAIPFFGEEGEVTVNLSNVLKVTKPTEGVSDMYLERTSGIKRATASDLANITSSR